MRASQKVGLIDAVARELQSRYTFSEIGAYLPEYGISIPGGSYTSQVTYYKEALWGVQPATLLKIVEDLEIGGVVANIAAIKPPRNWPDDSKFRLFISHIAAHKDKATRLRDCLVPYHISGFVAHQDIHPTAEWQIEIERALFVMDAFLAIHTPGFSKSHWTQQEIGFAVARRVKIISFKMGENPTGFISKRQVLPRLNRTAEAIAKEVDTILLSDERTSARLNDVIDASEIPF